MGIWLPHIKSVDDNWIDWWLILKGKIEILFQMEPQPATYRSVGTAFEFQDVLLLLCFLAGRGSSLPLLTYNYLSKAVTISSWVID